MDPSETKGPTADFSSEIAVDDEASIRRMLRLYEDLGAFASEIDPEDYLCIRISQTPKTLHVSGASNTPDITPVLAAVLQASLERRITIAEHVRVELAPAWAALSKPR